PALRPALRAAAVPAGPAGAPGLKPAAAPRPVVPIPGSTGAMKPAPAANDAVNKARAASYYELAQKDLAAGRLGRAWGYAQLAAENDPAEEKYAALLRDWDKLPGVRAGDKASTPQELMSAAQHAENGGDYDKAVALLQRLVEQAPSSAAGWNKLAVLLATRIKHFKPAYDAAIKAVELEPGNMAYQSNMMKILSRIDSDEKKTPGSPDNKGLLGRLLRR
ncbi:MAG TPA: tetratricopeptide repeat protein, partial [Myxococcota bacterium]